jgi:hypothetical protein
MNVRKSVAMAVSLALIVAYTTPISLASTASTCKKKVTIVNTAILRQYNFSENGDK